MGDIEAGTVRDLNPIGIAVLVVYIQGHAGPPKSPNRIFSDGGIAHQRTVVGIARQIRRRPIIKIPISD